MSQQKNAVQDYLTPMETLSFFFKKYVNPTIQVILISSGYL